MNFLFRKYCFSLLLFVPIVSFGYHYTTLDSIRKIQLDSITTNIPRNIKKDISFLHPYLHNLGQNDEERVWMYYGYIATHFKYDKERARLKKRAPYSVEYTVKMRSGVCTDFSELFKALCDKSDIPCLIVLGKAKIPITKTLYNMVRLISNKFNHAWNIVKVDNEWQLMDVTWSRVDSIHKYYVYSEDSSKHITGKVKIVNREYYNTPHNNMQKKHKPLNPAFSASEYVATWKTVLKKDKKEIVFSKDYNYAKEIDEIFAQKNTALGTQHLNTVGEYSRLGYYLAYSMLSWELDYWKEKTTKSNKHTIDDYLLSIERVEQLMLYLNIKFGSNGKASRRILLYYDKIAEDMASIRKKEEKILAQSNN